MVTAKIDIKRIIKEFVARLEPEVRVKKVILYGSYAGGRPDEWSDLDIAVISDDFKKMNPFKQAEFLALRKKGCDSRLEPIAFTLKEYETASHLTFLGEIKRTGKVIFEAE